MNTEKELLDGSTPSEAEWIESIIRQGSNVHLGNVPKGSEVKITIYKKYLDLSADVVEKVNTVMENIGFKRKIVPPTVALNGFCAETITLSYIAAIDVKFEELYRVRSKSCVETQPDFERGLIHQCSPSIGQADSLIGEVQSVELRGQVGGNHYAKCAIQPIDYIMANKLDYLQGNVIKYVTRYKDKNGVEDLEKAAHYLRIMIEREKQKDEAKS